MLGYRSHSGNRSDWLASALFNVFILIIPFIAANVLISGYSGVPHNEPATAEILAQARSDIDRAFEDLQDNGDLAREKWAALIATELDDRNMSAARGFLLAAPQMLSPGDKRAILEAAAADPLGNEDERLLRAALLFVPSDIRVNYESSLKPRGTDLITLQEEEPAVQVELADASTSLLTSSLTSMTHTPAFSVLGTVEDLVSRSRDWMRGNRQRSFEMRLTGIAMATPPSATGLDSETLIQAASVLKTAWRSDRLHPQYARLLSQRMAAALPEEELTSNLEIALSDVAILDVRAKRVQDAFSKSIDPHATARLGPEFLQVSQIIDATSPRGALSLLEHVESPTDISRARLIAQAGGDRAIALSSQIGSAALYVTGSGGLNWTRKTILWAMMLSAALIALLLSGLSVLQHALFGHRQDTVL